MSDVKVVRLVVKVVGRGGGSLLLLLALLIDLKRRRRRGSLDSSLLLAGRPELVLLLLARRDARPAGSAQASCSSWSREPGHPVPESRSLHACESTLRGVRDNAWRESRFGLRTRLPCERDRRGGVGRRRGELERVRGLLLLLMRSRALSDRSEGRLRVRMAGLRGRTRLGCDGLRRAGNWRFESGRRKRKRLVEMNGFDVG